MRHSFRKSPDEIFMGKLYPDVKKPQKMNFSPHRRLEFKRKIAAYRQGQDSISTRDLTLKIEKGIEILYNKQILKFGATYNKDNKSNLFVTVFARDSASKEITSDMCTLIPANALYRHPAPKIKRGSSILTATAAPVVSNQFITMTYL